MNKKKEYCVLDRQNTDGPIKKLVEKWNRNKLGNNASEEKLFYELFLSYVHISNIISSEPYIFMDGNEYNWHMVDVYLYMISSESWMK